MLGSYGLLGIFVYCEHKAGLTPPTNTHTDLFWLPVLLSVDRVKISGDIHTDRPGGQEKWVEEVVEEVVVWFPHGEALLSSGGFH